MMEEILEEIKAISIFFLNMVLPRDVARQCMTGRVQGKEKGKTHVRDKVVKKVVHPNSRKARQMNKSSIHNAKLSKSVQIR